MLPYCEQAWSVAVLVLIMGLATYVLLQVLQVLAGISEQEEHSSQDDIRSVASSSHTSRSLQATPEKQRDPSRERDPVGTTRSRRRRTTRRSLSLPTGSLSYGDVKITYRDGHFVTEPIAVASAGGDRGEGCDEKVTNAKYERSGSDTTAVLRGSFMNIGSQEEMREEIFSLLERGFSTEDITLYFSHYLDWNSNHLGSSNSDSVSGSQSGSTQSLTTAGLVSSLPRRYRTRDGANRPMSVDGFKLWEQISQSEQNLAMDGVDVVPDGVRKRNNSFCEAMETISMVDSSSLSQDVCDGGEVRLHRQNSEELRTDKNKSQRPGFIQRMLQKRKSFSEKTSSSKSQSQQKDEGSALSTRKEAREPITRKVSIKGIFRRKNSTTSLDSKKDPDEPGSPPIATFMNDDDIGAMNSLPGSPVASTLSQRVSSDSQVPSFSEGEFQSTTDLCSAVDPSMAVTRKESRRRQPGQRMSERYSGEYSLCEFDIASDCRSSEDTLTPLSTSPRSASPSSASTVTLEGDMSLLNRTLEGDTTLTDSQDVVEYGRETAGASHIMMQKPSLPKQEYSKLGMIMRGEITSSNSNDSGIQHDVNIGSSESLKQIPPEIASHLTSTVKLRNSPSPKQERPKSDFTVRWADLLEQVKETNVTYRREGNKLRKRPRPKSDLEDSCEDEGLEYDSTSSEEGGSSLLTDPILRPFGVGATGPLCPGTLGAGPSLQQCDSILSLVELRRPGNRGRLDAAALQAAKLAKSRRMSTPQPIKSRTEKIVPRSQRRTPIVRSHSMPENLDRLHRKKNYLSLIGSDMHAHHRSSGVEDDSSDESEFSVDYNQEKSLSTRASRATLVTLDQMIEEENFTYAEALWDHVTMDPDELGFRAGDLVRVTDMSEKHWWYGSTENRGGWFPASFVRLRVNQDGLEAEMTLQLQEEEEELQQQQLQQQPLLTTSTSKTQFRANVVNEIISAEKEYVKHLHDVIEGYVKQARKRPEMFPSEKVNIIFGNIEEIYEFATKLYSDLEKVVNTEQPHLTEFGHCFLDKTQGFEIYSEYCNNHPAACEELRVLYRAKQYRHFFEACRLLQEMTEIPLEGFLLTPVQKICKYHLQLAELLKYTPADHPDFNNVQAAVEEMKKIAKLVNERKRKMESIEKLAGWQMLVDDWEGPDILEGSSELIYSGELNKINANGWSQERYFFLFDHQLVYCKKDLLKKNSFGYKGRVNIDQSEIFNIPDGKDPQYNVNVRNAIKIHDKSRNKWFLMVAKSAQIKQRWIKAFADERRRVHDDQENNFNIPLRLKQSVIANLKQKANLSKSKGKRKVSRTSSMRTAKHDSWFSTSATLPRPSRKSSSSHQSGPTQQSNKLMSFLLGTKKKS